MAALESKKAGWKTGTTETIGNRPAAPEGKTSLAMTDQHLNGRWRYG